MVNPSKLVYLSSLHCEKHYLNEQTIVTVEQNFKTLRAREQNIFVWCQECC